MNRVKLKREYQMKNKILFIGLICLIFLTAINLLSQTFPRITEDEKHSAITSIREESEVINALIKQEDETINLTLIVEFGTSKGRAKKLGKNFIRLVKTASKDKDPGEEIGEGIYDYVIEVLYPNKKEVVAGAKARRARKVTWL